MYEHGLALVALERMKMQQALKQAIVNKELSLNFQPQLRSDGSLFGAEVLLRWSSPIFGFVSPAKFIPLAEETGLIHSIGAWVFSQSLNSIEQWQANSIPFDGHLSINVSAWQFALPNFADDIIHDGEDISCTEETKITQLRNRFNLLVGKPVLAIVVHHFKL